MTKGELVSAVAERSGLSRVEALRAIDSMVSVITAALRTGDEVKIVGFGSFLVSRRAGGQARNPRTGARVNVPASNHPKFRAGLQLRAAINES